LFGADALFLGISLQDVECQPAHTGEIAGPVAFFEFPGSIGAKMKKNRAFVRATRSKKSSPKRKALRAKPS
jgi:hypothetical protein